MPLDHANKNFKTTVVWLLAATLLAAVPFARAVNVIEFYNSNLDNYFITSDANEAAAIDGGSAGPGWSRTGYTFTSGGPDQICRFYGSQSPGPNSHFYTGSVSECQGLKDQQFPANYPRKSTVKSWNYEGLDFFSSAPLTPAGGGALYCATGLAPVYRAYNNGFARGVDSNHRITSSTVALQEVVNRGWKNEGVVMCAPAAASTSPYAGNWSGNYSGSDQGTCAMTISSSGTVSGSCTGNQAGYFGIAGTASSSGTLSFHLTSGNVSSATFSGPFVSTTRANGTWSIPAYGYTGTWVMTHN